MIHNNQTSTIQPFLQPGSLPTHAVLLLAEICVYASKILPLVHDGTQSNSQ